MQIQEKHVLQLADNVAEFDLCKFTVTPTGRKYGEPLSFKKGASPEIVKRHRDGKDKDYIAKITNTVSNHLMQILAKQYNAPLKVRSVDTAFEARPVDEKTFVGQEYWEQYSQVLVKLTEQIWVIDHPRTVAEEGEIVYDINGSKIVKIVRGKETVKIGEETIEGGIKVESKNDLFDVLKEAKILREHKTKATGGRIYFEGDNYPKIVSVMSDLYRDEGWLGALACRPSYEDDRGLVRPELVEPS